MAWTKSGNIQGPQGLPGVGPVLSADVAWAGDAVGTTYDYEFDDRTPDTTLPPGWSWVNQSTSTYNEDQGAGRITFPSTAGVSLVGLGRTPPAGDWTMTAKVSEQSFLVQYSGWGVFIRDSATGRITSLAHYWGGGAGVGTDYVAAFNWTSPTATPTDQAISATVFPQRQGYPQYFRIDKVGGNVRFWWSVDGRKWLSLAAAAGSYPATINHVGFCHYNYNAGGAGQVSCEWVRFRAAASTPTLSAPGYTGAAIATTTPSAPGVGASGSTGQVADAGHVHPSGPGVRRLGQLWTAKQSFTTTSFVAVTSSDVTFTMAKDGRVVAQWIVDVNSTTGGFGAWYPMVQLNGVGAPGQAGEIFITGAPRQKLTIQYEWWLLAGSVNTVRIGGNLGIATGTMDVNFNTSFGSSGVIVWVYDQ